MRLWVASRSLALMNHGRVNHWANKWMNEWVSEWVYSMGESWPAKAKLKRSRCSAAMHCEFFPLWQIHKLRHSTINKWRRQCRDTARVFCRRNCQGKRQQESGRERERDRQSRQLQRVCQAAKSVANYAIQSHSLLLPLQPPAPCPLPPAHSRMLVNSLSVLFPHCRCLRQLRYTKAKSERQKAKSDGPNDMWKYANAKYQKWMNWVWSTGLSGPWAYVWYGMAGDRVYGCEWVRGQRLTALHFPLIKYNGPRHKTRVVKHSVL